MEKKTRIGIICPSEIAYRRFLPALKKCGDFEFAGVAVASREEWDGELTDEMHAAQLAKAEAFGGRIFGSYTELVHRPDVDAVYLPLPPALHYRWGRLALEAGKHAFLEKPSTTSLSDTGKLLRIARERRLAVHENYMFRFHSQLERIREIADGGELGDIRLYRIAFGFPKRAENDFRYNAALGGGALLDCGGYTVRLAGMLLGETARVATSSLSRPSGYGVDIHGSATMVNDAGTVAQLAFGMDNAYKCELEIWGSRATLYTNRILTAPDGFEPTVRISSNDGVKDLRLEADDSFGKSIRFFGDCIRDADIRQQSYRDILKQAELVETIKGGN